METSYDLIEAWPTKSDHEISQIFRDLSALYGRFTRIQTTIAQDKTPVAVSFRNQEVVPFLENLKMQFQFWSRIFAIQEADLKYTVRGQT
jgi:hypothetical protein